MKYYINCYYADGKQILGNGDGQAVIHAKQYGRTRAYKRIRAIVACYDANGVWPHNRVHHAETEAENGKIVEVIQ